MANAGAAGQPGPDDNPDDVILPNDVAAIEVYGTSGVPVQYKVPNSCGTILVWTRHGPKQGAPNPSR